MCRTMAGALAGGLLSTLAAVAQPMTLEARLAQPVMQAGEAQRNFLRIGLGGCKPERAANRTPVNVAFVIDRSGSMHGARIAQAREVAIMAVNRLDANDVASVVIFDEKIDVLVPAQQVLDRRLFIDRIRQVGARGRTAIHDGVVEGAREVRKFFDARRLNRVVLLSDGQANVGPSKAEDFARLGRELLEQGISVSTIGLGHDYNEDLMLQLARASDGNHAYAAAPDDLIKIFNREFDDVLASCAQMVSIEVELAPGVRAMRALSREGSIAGDHAKFQLNQVYQATEHYVLLEVELDGGAAGTEQELGRVRVAYSAPEGGARRTLEAPIKGRFASAAEAKASLDQTVMESVVEQSTRARAQLAIALRDQGKHEEARKLFLENAAEIRAYLANGGKKSPALEELQNQYGLFASQAVVTSPTQWNLQRKQLHAIDARGAGSSTRY